VIGSPISPAFRLGSEQSLSGISSLQAGISAVAPVSPAFKLGPEQSLSGISSLQEGSVQSLPYLPAGNEKTAHYGRFLP